MNKKNILLCCVFLIVISTFAYNRVEPDRARTLFNKGEFSALGLLADSLRQSPKSNPASIALVDSLMDIASRIKLDFSISEPKAEAQMRTRIGSFSLDDKKKWEQNDWLEFRLIDGQKRYFNRAVSNLKLRLTQYNDSAAHRKPALDSLSAFRLRHTAQAIAHTHRSGDLSCPVNYILTYTLSVKPDAVPAGEVIRCWLPFPKENRARQHDVKLIETSQPDYILSPDSVDHRSLYMEQKAVSGKSTDFKIRVSFTAAAQYFNLDKLTILPYKKKSDLYRKYTAQQAPHIVFSEQVKALADKIVGKEKRPEKIVRKLYEWIDGHIIWSGALEYSTMPMIPEYVLQHRRGDCGMQTLLFMTMARYKGVPVKWQSGWMLHPNEVNLHDWCEVYYEGVGWVPLDMSFGLQPDANNAVRNFYMSGMDAYRLIVNDGISAPFDPAKKYMRSETVDFQRGEVEWSKGNLYFDKWNYHMDVDYK